MLSSPRYPKRRTLLSKLLDGAMIFMAFIVVTTAISIGENGDPYEWHAPLVEQGPGTWVKPLGSNHEPIDVDYMLPVYFHAYSLSNGLPVKSEGWGMSSNVHRTIPESATFAPGRVILVARADLETPFNDAISGIPVYLANRSGDPLFLIAQDSRLPMIVEALDTAGIWRPIEYIPETICGNSFHVLRLPTYSYWSFVVPQYSGRFPTRMRLRLLVVKPGEHEIEYPNALADWHGGPMVDNQDVDLDTLYSNEWTGRINPGQFEQRQGHEGADLMDLYHE